MSPSSHTHHILLADDDKDDADLFQEVLEELPLATQLEAVFNGDQLMQRLNEKREKLPDVLFLDLNMPRKNGFECLSEIKQNESLMGLPVIIFSTSIEPDLVNLLYKNGAQYYIRKPNEYSNLKKVIYLALTLISQPMPVGQSGNLIMTPKEKFVLTPETFYNEKK